jgi:uncharacterized membrane-anchored protein
MPGGRSVKRLRLFLVLFLLSFPLHPEMSFAIEQTHQKEPDSHKEQGMLYLNSPLLVNRIFALLSSLIIQTALQALWLTVLF